MNADIAAIAHKYIQAQAQAKARAAEYGSSVYVLATLAVHSGVPCVTGFTISDFHDGTAVCRVNVSRSGAATISEI